MALGLLKSLLGCSECKRPAYVATDEILPIYDFDSRPQVRDIIIGWTLRFDDILDADKLHVALSRLLEIGDWKKLGGRLRRKVSKYRGRLLKSIFDRWMDQDFCGKLYARIDN